MKKNMGQTDRVIRLIAGIVLLLLAIFVVSGALAGVFYVLAAIMLVTSFIGTCPLYMPFHISTKK